MVIYIILLMCVATDTVAAYVHCPHTAPYLQKWSRKTTWPDNRIPSTGDHVNITTHIILDVSPPPLFNIHIKKTGRLVVSPHVKVELHVKHIMVEGKLEIGSETCPHEGEVDIILEGRRGEYDIGDAEKSISVLAGGTLELHGKKKLSWTKLAKTVPKVTPLYNKRTEDLTSEDGRWIDAILAATITPIGYEQFTMRTFGVYRIFSSWIAERQDHMQYLTRHLENVSYGDIVLLATQRRTIIYEEFYDLCDKLEKLAYEKATGSSAFRNVTSDSVYAATLQKGKKGSFTESLFAMDVSQATTEAKIFINDWTNGLKFTAASLRHTENDFHDGASITITKTSTSYPIVEVIDDGVSTWNLGDKVILTSTDYDWMQVEEGTIVPCPQCSTKQIRLDLEPKFIHWGEMIDNVLDERGEVGLISRNIRIQGSMEKTCPPANGNCGEFAYDSFGGHIRITEGFRNVHIEGVELRNVGQQTDRSRYPIHFHMCFDVRNHTEPVYIRNNSIYNSFARCVTIHATSGVTVSDNVCYKFLGHGIFLEEGGEKWNTIDGNLLIGSMPGSHIPSDRTPAAFWITNPLNFVRNNVAAGGNGNGFWFLFPDEPIGQSKGIGLMAPGEARHTPVLEFDNNIMHSFAERGLVFDNILEADGTASGINNYQPRRHPLDENSDEVEVVFSRITAFKNRHSNAWIRGGAIRVTKSSFADSVDGLIFASSNSMAQTVSETVFIGDTANEGEPFHKDVKGSEYHLNRSLALPFTPEMPRTGFLFYDGPVFVENVWFNNFSHNSLYKMGAIGFNRNNVFGRSSVSSVQNVLFGFDDNVNDGNRAFFGDITDYGYADMDGDLVSTFRNYDGSMWGLTFTQTIKPIPFHLTAGCFIRPNAKMAFCTEKYGKVRFHIIDGNPKTKVIGVRDDVPSAMVTQDARDACEFLTALGGRYSYTFHFMDRVPKVFEVSGEGVEKNEWVRIGICLPRNAKFNLSSWTPHWLPMLNSWTSVKSFDELESKTKDGEKYYFSTTTGMLYIKLISKESRPNYHHGDCFGYCPRIKITVVRGNRSDADCRKRLYNKDELNKMREVNQYPRSVAGIPASATSPPQGWGAGSTRPFHNRRGINDAYDDKWSSWSTCSVSCGGGKQTRKRQCEFPAHNDSRFRCDGQSEEQRSCNEHDCVVNGGFSEWSPWTDCISVTNCQGLQSRKRFCINPIPQGGGQYCNGAVEEVKSCSACNPFSHRISKYPTLTPYDTDTKMLRKTTTTAVSNQQENRILSDQRSGTEDVKNSDIAIDEAVG